ncbi:MAG TPA: energy-coupling factor ABC transporter permease [Marinobacterium sp.]|nr:energy-coupling factor ABC transporter permease [Marinobacterium sp.]
MNTQSIELNLIWQISAALLVGIVLLLAARRIPLSALRSEPRLQHLLYASTILLMLTWSFRAGLSEGLSIHFLGMTTLTLMFGWDLALLAGSVAMVLLTLIGIESWQILPLNLLTQVLVPATVCMLILGEVEKRLPANFFIYLFIVAFLGGGVTVASSGLSLAAVLGLAGVHEWGKIYTEYVRYLPLIMFPEGLINGILMTAMMVFHPDWIRTFDARRYIDEQ